MAQLQEEELPLPNEVRGIIEASRKNILFPIMPLLWVKENRFIFILLTKFFRLWHPRSSKPLHEVKFMIC
jgi:hypothetical protein